MTTIADFEVMTNRGEPLDLSSKKGKVLLVVNTASKCGFTPQYDGLEKLYQQFKDDDFEVLGFPCNQFGSQEPGSDGEIAKFCSTKYDVTFPMFSKIDVNGEKAAPIYKHLTSVDAKPAGKGPISWNFCKFLIDRDGQVASRFKHSADPTGTEMVKAIESELQKKK